jgi:hypothetical protein
MIGYYVADVDPEHTPTLGIYRFTIKLLEHLIEKNINLIMFCCEGNDYLFKKFKKKNAEIVTLKRFSSNRVINRLAFDQIIINRYIKKENIEVMLFPKGHIPLTKIRGARYYPVIHDLIPIYYIKNKRLPYSTRLKSVPVTILLIIAAKKADMIFTVSEFSKKEISKYTNEEKIKVIPAGSDIRKPFEKLTKEVETIGQKAYFYLIGNANPN